MDDAPKVLVVDGVQDNVWIVEDILQGRCRVIGANDCSRALQTAREHLPDLILLDASARGSSGPETCRQLKSDPALSPIPVIFLVSRERPEAIREGFDAGGADYILKPFDSRELRARVEGRLLLAKLEGGTSPREEIPSAVRETRGELLAFFSKFSSDIVLEINAGGVILSANPAWEQIVGTPVSAPVGKYFYELVEAGDARALSLDLQRAWHTRRLEFEAALTLAPIGGGLRVAAAFALEYGEDESFAGLVCLLRPAAAP